MVYELIDDHFQCLFDKPNFLAVIPGYLGSPKAAKGELCMVSKAFIVCCMWYVDRSGTDAVSATQLMSTNTQSMRYMSAGDADREPMTTGGVDNPTALMTARRQVVADELLYSPAGGGSVVWSELGRHRSAAVMSDIYQSSRRAGVDWRSVRPRYITSSSSSSSPASATDCYSITASRPATAGASGSLLTGASARYDRHHSAVGQTVDL